MSETTVENCAKLILGSHVEIFWLGDVETSSNNHATLQRELLYEEDEGSAREKSFGETDNYRWLRGNKRILKGSLRQSGRS